MSELEEDALSATAQADARIGLVALCDTADVTPDMPLRVVVADVAYAVSPTTTRSGRSGVTSAAAQSATSPILASA